MSTFKNICFAFIIVKTKKIIRSITVNEEIQ